MNYFAESKIDQLTDLIRDLAKTLEEYERRLQRAQEEREVNLKEQWALKREFNALSETVKRLPEYEQENEALREKCAISLGHARRILDFAKTLSGAAKQ